MFNRFLSAMLLLLPATALAQDYRSKYEVFGSAGYGATYDDEGGIGRGLDIGAGFGVRPIGRLGFEGSVNRISHLREFAFNGVRFEGTGVFASANALYHFSDSKAQPYVIGGIGVLHHEDRSSGLGPARPPRSGSGFSYNFGAGLKLFVSKRVSVRPEFRVFIGDLGKSAGTEPPFSLLRGSVGIGYHW